MSSVRAILAAAIIAALAGCSNPPPPEANASAPAAAPAAAPPGAPVSSSSSGWPSDLLPLPEVPFAPARPMPVVESVFRFAAEHPEVLSKMPCFCGCENRGHRHNDDCFVAARDER